MRRDIVSLVLVLVAVAAEAADTRLLLQSGTPADDGFGIASFRQPAAAPGGRLGFVGSTSALFVDDSHAVSAVLRTGDPLPAPLGGTFNEFGRSAINDRGTVAFVATVNEATTTGGVFRLENGVVTLVATGNAAAPDINGRGDVLFRQGTALRLVRAGSGEVVTVVRRGDPMPGGGELFQGGLRPVLSDSEAVAFVAELRTERRRRGSGVFVWDAAAGIRAVALEGGPSPVAGLAFTGFDRRQAVAISAGGIAFVAGVGEGPSGVFHFDKASGGVSLVAMSGHVVGGEVLTGISERFVGINARGDVAFVGELGGRSRLVVFSDGTLSVPDVDIGASSSFAPRLTDAGSVAWVRNGMVERHTGRSTSTGVVGGGDAALRGFAPAAPDLSDAGVTVFGATRAAVYRVGRSGIEALMRTGEDVAGFGVVAGVDVLALGGRSAAVVAFDGVGGSALLLGRSGRFERIVATGDPAPGGGTFVLDSVSPALRGSRILFSAEELVGVSAGRGIFVTDVRTGRIEPVVRHGEPGPGGRTMFEPSGFA